MHSTQTAALEMHDLKNIETKLEGIFIILLFRTIICSLNCTLFMAQLRCIIQSLINVAHTV